MYGEYRGLPIVHHSGAFQGYRARQNGDRGAGRVQEFVSAGADMPQYVGRFYNAELNVTFETAWKLASLEVRAKGVPPMTFQPNRPDSFNNGGTTINFRRDARGQIESLSFGGNRVLNVVFVKQP